MHTRQLVVAALAAAASLVSADERPRIYFPRHVKRQFVNATITQAEPHPAPSPTPFAPSSQTSKRQSVPDFLPGLPDLFGDGTSTESGSGSSSSSGDEPFSATSAVLDPTSVPDSSGIGIELGGGIGTIGTIPDIVVLPTSTPSSGADNKDPSTTGDSTDSTTASTGGILLGPGTLGVVTSSVAPPLLPVESVISDVVSQLTSALAPPANATVTPTASGTTPPAPPEPTTTTPPIISISIPLTIPPTITVVPTLNVTDPPITTELPPPPINTTTIIPPPPPTSTFPNVTDQQPPPPTTTLTDPPPTTVPPPPTSTPNDTAIGNATITTLPPLTSEPPPTSLPSTTEPSPSETWLPTTILVQPSPTTPRPTGLAPTATSGLPTGLPKAITPDTGNGPVPVDTQEIQIGFLYGFNYGFLVMTPKAAAQILTTLPQLLSYQGGFDPAKVVVRRLVPYDTQDVLGYVTTIAVVTYPQSLVDQLRMDMHIPTAPLWQNPNRLAYNMSLEINTAIDILLGSTLEWGPSGTGGGAATSTSGPNDMFSGDGGSEQSSAQKGMTAGLAVGAVFLSAAYGGAMFVIARRYKKKKQSHHRTSSVVTPSAMRHTGSPALMGGALLSRDFTSTYGGVGGVAGGRESHGSHGSHGTHGSGRTGTQNSGRTAYISAPVAAENSLGWN